MIRCVMFDFGNVLGLFDIQKYYDFITVHQRPGTVGPEYFFHADHVVKYELGFIDEFEFFEAEKRIFGLGVSMDDYFFMFGDLVRPDLRMIALKQVLRHNGIKLAVVSNINRYHFGYVQAKWPEVFSGFDYLALSFRLIIRKPDFGIFDASAKHLGVPPEKCFLIDDLNTNVDAFERWGGSGHHYNVVDDRFCPNGKLETERNRLILKLASLGMLSRSQVGNMMRIFKN